MNKFDTQTNYRLINANEIQHFTEIKAALWGPRLDGGSHRTQPAGWVLHRSLYVILMAMYRGGIYFIPNKKYLTNGVLTVRGYMFIVLDAAINRADITEDATPGSLRVIRDAVEKAEQPWFDTSFLDHRKRGGWMGEKLLLYAKEMGDPIKDYSLLVHWQRGVNFVREYMSLLP